MHIPSWRARYLGSVVVATVQSEAGMMIVGAAGLTSWQAGGCALLAATLQDIYGAGRIYVLRRTDGAIDHVVWGVVSESYYDYEPIQTLYCFDADGCYTEGEMVEKHLALEGHEVVIEEILHHEDETEIVRGAGIPWPGPEEHDGFDPLDALDEREYTYRDASRHLKELLQDALPDEPIGGL